VSSQLQAGSQTTLATVAGVVTGRITLGPTDQRGPAKWNVDQILIKTSRPGVAPIPRCEIYIDDPNAGNLQALTYDGSYGAAGGSCTLVRGQTLTAVWTGGLAGDVASFTLTGTKE
jgi:hypothetical protein